MIEDDRDIALGIRTVLTRNGFEVASSPDGRHGLRAFHAARPDLVVLDIGLPTMDGWQVLERIRDLSDVPVLILTAHGTEADKVRGLHGGADDYLTKPFGNRELAARVEALLRRPRSQLPEQQVYDDGRLLVRLDLREVTVNGQPVALTPTEFRLLAALVRHPGQTLSRRSAARAGLERPDRDRPGTGEVRHHAAAAQAGAARRARLDHRGGPGIRLPVRGPGAPAGQAGLTPGRPGGQAGSEAARAAVTAACTGRLPVRCARRGRRTGRAAGSGW